MVSYMLLTMINPRLTNFQILSVKTVDTEDSEEKGCCEFSNGESAKMLTEKDCKSDKYGDPGVFKGSNWKPVDETCISGGKENCNWYTASDCNNIPGAVGKSFTESTNAYEDCGTKTGAYAENLKSCCCE
jgi:hypothetical protein